MILKRIKIIYYCWRESLLGLFINTFISKFPSRHIRLFLLRILGAKIGKVAMYAGFEIRNPKGLTIEDGCSIGPKVLLDARKGLIIKKNVTIATDAIIWTLHHDYNDDSFKTVGDTVTVGEYAWICSRSIILPGVKVGKCAVIAAGAVVTKDVPDYTVVGGVPAKVLGQREKKEYRYTPYRRFHIV